MKTKNEIINYLSHDELTNFVSLIDDNVIRQLLSSMNIDYFFKICESFQKNSEMTKKKILELKKSTMNTAIDENQ